MLIYSKKGEAAPPFLFPAALDVSSDLATATIIIASEQAEGVVMLISGSGCRCGRRRRRRGRWRSRWRILSRLSDKHTPGHDDDVGVFERGKGRLLWLRMGEWEEGDCLYNDKNGSKMRGGLRGTTAKSNGWQC